uniref:Uncharacterized protein n=1 Tax=Rhizophagus irregularis (strain DAOM 181602 / DAOM 197198 / MUCL 43194) TaxID=747089 RepID=U9UV82_RHIID
MKFKQYQPARSRQLNPSRHSSSQKGYICPQTQIYDGLSAEVSTFSFPQRSVTFMLGPEFLGGISTLCFFYNLLAYKVPM